MSVCQPSTPRCGKRFVLSPGNRYGFCTLAENHRWSCADHHPVVQEDAAISEYPKPEHQPVRDVLASLLRMRGYTHNDADDPLDKYWCSPDGGRAHLLAYIAYEMNVDLHRPTPGWDTFPVSVAR